MGWGARDRSALRAEVETLVRVAPDLAVRDELVLSAARGVRHTSASVVTFRAAAFEERVGLVATGRGDRLERLVFVEPELAALRATFAELAAGGDDDTVVSPRAPGPVAEEAVAMMRLCAHAVNERDWDAVAATYAVDVSMVDRRTMGWEETRGTEPVLEIARQIAALSPDVWVVSEALAGWARDDRTIWAGMCTFGGHEAEHGTRFEVRFGTLGYARGGRTILTELLPDDDDAVLRRYEELVAEYAEDTGSSASVAG